MAQEVLNLSTSQPPFHFSFLLGFPYFVLPMCPPDKTANLKFLMLTRCCLGFGQLLGCRFSCSVQLFSFQYYLERGIKKRDRETEPGAGVGREEGRRAAFAKTQVSQCQHAHTWSARREWCRLNMSAASVHVTFAPECQYFAESGTARECMAYPPPQLYAARHRGTQVCALCLACPCQLSSNSRARCVLPVSP